MWGVKERKHNAVLPDNDDDGWDPAVMAKCIPPPRSKRPSTGVRWTSMQAWIWIFLVLNLVVILTFIFASAKYFPKTPPAREVFDQPTRDLFEQPAPIHTESITEQPNRQRPPDLTVYSVDLTDDIDMATTPPKYQKTSLDTVTPTMRSTPSEGSPLDVTFQESQEVHEPTGDPVERQPNVVNVMNSDLNVESSIHPTMHESMLDGIPTTERATVIESSPAVDLDTADQQIPSHVAKILERMKASQQQKEESASETPVASNTEHEIVPAKSSDAPSSSRLTPAKQQTDLKTNLAIWLKADAGVEVLNQPACLQSPESVACEVTSWTSQARSETTADPISFKPTASSRPVWVPSDEGLPKIAFPCPLTAKAVFPDVMTLFFVMSPKQLTRPESYQGQKFFGSSPYGQFALHAGRPAFIGSTGLIEGGDTVSPGQTAIIAYRLQRDSMEVKIAGRTWSSLPKSSGDSEPIRVSRGGELSLGNVKAICDSNAFEGTISEVMIYNTLLDEERVAAIESYLQGRCRRDSTTAAAQVAPVEVTVHQSANNVPFTSGAKRGESAVEKSPQIDENGMSTHDSNQESTATLVDEPSDRATATYESSPEGYSISAETINDQLADPIGKFDPELVFEWVPSPELLNAKGLPSTAAGEWAAIVKEKIDTIRNFEMGGEALRDFIHEQKEDLLHQHAERFG